MVKSDDRDEIDETWDWWRKEFGCSFLKLRGNHVQIVGLGGFPSRVGVFRGLLTNDHGDVSAIIEEGDCGILEQVHPSRLRRLDFDDSQTE